MGTPFKMKGSPMQRNFGISPVRQTDNSSDTTSVKKENKETEKGGYVMTRGAILDNYRLGLFNKAQRNILLEDHGFEIPKDESSFEDPE